MSLSLTESVWQPKQSDIQDLFEVENFIKFQILTNWRTHMVMRRHLPVQQLMLETCIGYDVSFRPKVDEISEQSYKLYLISSS